MLSATGFHLDTTLLPFVFPSLTPYPCVLPWILPLGHKEFENLLIKDSNLLKTCGEPARRSSEPTDYFYSLFFSSLSFSETIPKGMS
jgi:hypothetical protein